MQQNGAIRITNSKENNVLTSETFFHSSHSRADGGSVFVQNGACIQYRICSINSSIPVDNYVWGCHSRVETTEENFIVDCSISKYSGYCNSVDLRGGNQIIESTNISYGKCTWEPAYGCRDNPVSNHVNFTSIINNTCDKEAIIFHGGNSHYMSRCNIIKNVHNRVEYLYGIICFYSGKEFVASFCVLSMNQSPSLFYNDKVTKFIVDHCFLDNNIADTTTSGNSVSLTTTNSLVLKLSYLSTQDCHADFPIIDKVNRFSFFDEYENQLCGAIFLPCIVS